VALRIAVDNFGPVGTADLRLRPLTAFIGPNNTGKSALAGLVYACMLASPHSYSPAASRRAPFRGRPRPQPSGEQAKRLRTFVKEAVEHPNLAKEKFPDDFLKYVTDRVDESLDFFRHTFRREIERCFNAKIGELVGSGSGALRVRVEPSAQWSVTLERPRRGALKYSMSRPGNAMQLIRRALRAMTWYREDGDPSRSVFGDALTELHYRLSNELFRDFSTFTYYLPAARSGVMQSHRLLASSVIRSAALAGIEPMEVPRMTGVVSDFLAQLIDVDQGRQTPLAPVADFLEQHLLRGKVEFKDERTAYPEIYYESGGRRFRLHRTSSMISELAPLVLFLRYQLDPNEFLIVEEPESSLHPQSQLVLADAVAQLVNRHLRVLLTTHSDHFLIALNNAIQAGTLESQERDSGVAINSLRSTEVSAYLFEPHPRGTKVRRLPVSPRYGISSREFARVTEQLYSEAVALDDRF
jgi:predicted ATPase